MSWAAKPARVDDQLEAGDAGLVELILTAADSLDQEIARVRTSEDAKAYVVPAMQRSYLAALNELDERLERRRDALGDNESLDELMARFDEPAERGCCEGRARAAR